MSVYDLLVGLVGLPSGPFESMVLYAFAVILSMVLVMSVVQIFFWVADSFRLH